MKIFEKRWFLGFERTFPCPKNRSIFASLGKGRSQILRIWGRDSSVIFIPDLQADRLDSSQVERSEIPISGGAKTLSYASQQKRTHPLQNH